MRIDTKLKLNLFISAILPLLVTLGVALTFRGMDHYTAKLIFADQIEYATLALSGLCQDQAGRLPLNRPAQWATAMKELEQLLASPSEFDGQPDFMRLRRAHQDIAVGLSRLDPPGTPTASAAEDPHGAAYADIEEAIKALSADAAHFKNRIYTAFNRLSRGLGISAICFVVIFAVTVGCSVAWGGRRLMKRFTCVTEGMRAVANGDLTHRIGMSSKDELGEVAREFDRMTSRLSETGDTE